MAASEARARSVPGDLSSVGGSLVYVAHGVVTALAPSRLLIGTLAVVAITLAGWLFDSGYLLAGGRSAPPAGTAVRTENPTAEAERVARRTVATFAAGTAVAATLVPETPFSALAGVVDAAGREKLAAAGDAERARNGVLVDWDRARSTIERARPRGPAEYLSDGLGGAARRLVAGLVGWSPTELASSVVDALVRAPSEVLAAAPLGGSIWLVLALVLASASLAPLGRMSAVEAARGEKLTAGAALAWLRGAALRSACVPLAPLTIVALMAVVVLGVGLLLRVPGLDLLGGLLYGIALLATTLALVTGAAALLGLPLSLAAVAAGDADALDASVRSTAYLFRYPIRTVGLAFVAIVSVGCGLLVVGAGVAAVLGVAAWGVGILGGEGAASAAGAPSLFSLGGRSIGEASARLSGLTERPAGALVDLWEAAFAMALLGYLFSAVIECATRMYVALRFACDGEDPSSIDGVPLGRPMVSPPTTE